MASSLDLARGRDPRRPPQRRPTSAVAAETVRERRRRGEAGAQRDLAERQVGVGHHLPRRLQPQLQRRRPPARSRSVRANSVSSEPHRNPRPAARSRHSTAAGRATASITRIARATRGSRSPEPAERDERLRVRPRMRLVVDEHARHIERHRRAEPARIRCSIRSNAGDAPPAVITRPSITKRSATHLGVAVARREVLEVLPVRRRAPARPAPRPRRAPRPPTRCPPPPRSAAAAAAAAPAAAGRRAAARRSPRPPPAGRRAASAVQRPLHRQRQPAGQLDRRAVGADHPPGDALVAADPVAGPHRVEHRGHRHHRRPGSTSTVTESGSSGGGEQAHCAMDQSPLRASVKSGRRIRAIAASRDRQGEADGPATEPRGVHHLRRHRRRRHHRPLGQGAGHAAPDRRRGDRGGARPAPPSPTSTSATPRPARARARSTSTPRWSSTSAPPASTWC